MSSIVDNISGPVPPYLGPPAPLLSVGTPVPSGILLHLTLAFFKHHLQMKYEIYWLIKCKINAFCSTKDYFKTPQCKSDITTKVQFLDHKPL